MKTTVVVAIISGIFLVAAAFIGSLEVFFPPETDDNDEISDPFLCPLC